MTRGGRWIFSLLYCTVLYHGLVCLVYCYLLDFTVLYYPVFSCTKYQWGHLTVLSYYFTVQNTTLAILLYYPVFYCTKYQWGHFTVLSYYFTVQNTTLAILLYYPVFYCTKPYRGHFTVLSYILLYKIPVWKFYFTILYFTVKNTSVAILLYYPICYGTKYQCGHLTVVSYMLWYKIPVWPFYWALAGSWRHRNAVRPEHPNTTSYFTVLCIPVLNTTILYCMWLCCTVLYCKLDRVVQYSTERAIQAVLTPYIPAFAQFLVPDWAMPVMADRVLEHCHTPSLPPLHCTKLYWAAQPAAYSCSVPNLGYVRNGG